MRAKTLISKATLFKVIFLCLLMLPTIAMAVDPDDLPCGGDDPYATDCPLDTWLWPMVIGTIGFAVYSINTAKGRTEP
jgi:hypothetical protein